MMTSESPIKTIEVGIELLIDGKTFAFEDVVFFIDRASEPPTLQVNSYSACIHLENVNEQEAKEKIERSKKVGDHLSASYPAFSEIWNSMRKRFEFCYEYGTGAVLIASEEEGAFRWHKK